MLAPFSIEGASSKAGAVQQGVREQNYIRRPLDLLRVHHERIKAWTLKEAGIEVDAKAAPAAGLRVVSAA